MSAGRECYNCFWNEECNGICIPSDIPKWQDDVFYGLESERKKNFDLIKTNAELAKHNADTVEELINYKRALKDACEILAELGDTTQLDCTNIRFKINGQEKCPHANKNCNECWKEYLLDEGKNL